MDFQFKNFTITEGPFDSRYYVQSISATSATNLSPSTFADELEAIDHFVGIGADGSQTIIPIEKVYNSSGLITFNTMIDTQAKAQVEAYVVQVKAGQIADVDVPKVTPTFTSVRFVYKDGYEVPPGAQFGYTVTMAFNDPYHLQQVGPIGDEINKTKNFMTTTGTVVTPDHEEAINITNGSLYTLVTLPETASISKSTTGNATGNVGERIRYNISINLSKLGGARYIEGGKVIDILPEGFTAQTGIAFYNPMLGVGETGKAIEIIRNYQNSGRDAVIFNFASGELAEITGGRKTYTLAIDGVINSKAIRSGLETAENNNDNHVYYLTNN